MMAIICYYSGRHYEHYGEPSHCFFHKEAYGHSIIHASVTHDMPGTFLVTMDTAMNKTNVILALGGFCQPVAYNIYNIYHPFLHHAIKSTCSFKCSGCWVCNSEEHILLFMELFSLWRNSLPKKEFTFEI